MIVTRTPLRISFAGGGTDMAAFYSQDEGAVLSAAINQYVYVTVKRHSEFFFEPIRVNYKKSEEAHTIDEIENNIVRECLRFLEVGPPIYVSTVGDVPASTGLGGSSAFAVGLLNALHAVKGERVSAGQLADEACHIEIDVLGEPIGKQDQYAAAFGGFNVFSFRPDGPVTVEHQQPRVGVQQELFSNLMMFWTGEVRDASDILSEQQESVPAERERLLAMRNQVTQLQKLLQEDLLDTREFGRVLDAGWQLKRGLASGVSNTRVDDLYRRGVEAGAHGGKLCGAGGGGFLLFVVDPQQRASVTAALSDLSELPVAPEVNGSQLVVPFHE